MNKILKTLLIVFATICILLSAIVLTVLWGIHKHEKAYQPRWSYGALMSLASGFDDYRKQNGVWPADINQLVKFRPDLYPATTDSYSHAIILIPYNDAVGYGELISYGRDGKPGGDNKFDRDIIVRFPMETETNAEWNKQIGERFKHPLSQ